MLSDRQRTSLHSSIIEYLQSLDIDCDELSNKLINIIPLPITTNTTLLEKKWVSVVRLQKKVLELEDELKSSNISSSGPGIQKSTGRLLPTLDVPPLTCLGHRGGGVNSLSLHPTFSLLASAGEDGVIKLWDAESGEFIKTLKGHTGSVQNLAFNEEGTRMISSSSDLTLKVWDAEQDYACVKTLRGHTHNVSAAKFLKGSNASTIISTGRDGTIKFWDLTTGFCNHTIQPTSEPPNWIRCIAVSPGGGVFATGGNDNVVNVWDVEGRKVRHELRGHEHVVNSVAFPDTETDGNGTGVDYMLVSASRDKTVRVWDASTGGEICVFRNHCNWVRSVKVHRNPNFIVSVGDDRSLMVFDLKNKRCVREIKDAGTHFLQAMDMHKTLAIVATAGADNEIKIWKCD